MLDTGLDIEGKYRLEGRLGRGGQATVYLARHLRDDTLHAIKVLHLPAQFRRRIEQEGAIQTRLVHPHIVAVTDIVEVEGALGLVLEYVHGPSLAQLLAGRVLTFEQTDEIVRGALRGVAEAHRGKVVHRDLKPQNILLQIRGRQLWPKIADFGVAKLLENPTTPGLTETGQMVGSRWYMAPEQVRDSKSVDHRADVWALGAILYEMTTRVRPFAHQDPDVGFQRIRDGEFVPVEQLRPDLPARMRAAIGGALVVRREDRWPTVDDLLAAWEGGTPAPIPQVWPEDVLAAPVPEPVTVSFGSTASASDAAGTTTNWRRRVLGRTPTPAPVGDRDVRSPPRWRASLVGGGVLLSGLIAWGLWTTAVQSPSPVPPPRRTTPAPPDPAAVAPAEVVAPADRVEQPRPKPQAPAPPQVVQDVSVTLKSRPVATQSVLIDEGRVAASRNGMTWLAKLPPGPHTFDLHGADGSSAQVRVEIRGPQQTVCWDYDGDLPCSDP